MKKLNKHILFLTLFSLWTGPPLFGSPDIEGYIKTRYSADQKSDHEFSIYETSLSKRFFAADRTSVFASLYIYPDENDIEVSEFYADFYDFPEFGPSATGRLIVGKARNYCFGIVPDIKNRKTAGYGIIAEYLTDRRVTGIQYILDYNQIFLSMGAFNGFRITGKPYGVEGALLALDDLEAENNMNKELSLKFSVTTSDNITMSFSGASAELTDEDNALISSLTGTDMSGKTYSAFGVDYTYELPEFLVSGEIYSITVGDIDSMVYGALGGLHLNYETSAYLRAEYIDYEGSGEKKGFSAGWDKLQITPSVKYVLKDGVWVQLEANWNDEFKPSGADKLKNNELFAELHVGF